MEQKQFQTFYWCSIAGLPAICRGINMENITDLIKDFKMGNKDAFILIYNRMRPLILKYSHLLFFNEFEDMQSELTLALLEAVIKINYYHTEGEVISYISKAIMNRFYELYRTSKARTNEVQIEDSTSSKFDLIAQYCPTEYTNVILKADLSLFIEILPEMKKSIASAILFEDLSDIEIGRKYSISRQYVHRIRLDIRRQLADEFSDILSK